MNIKEINTEYKATVLFAAIALVVTFLAGILGGVSITVVIIRMIIAGLVFAGIGFAAAFVVKKYVPELMDITSVMEPSETPDVLADEGEAPVTGEYEQAAYAEGGMEPSAGSEGFTEFTGEEFPRVSSKQEQGLDDSLDNPTGNGRVDTSRGKMGKHIIADEKTFQYEPKLMAQAVRTMMKKDE